MDIVVEETPWRTAVQCGKPLCARQYALTPGFYMLSLASYSGGVWGPPRTITFDVDENGVTPSIASPAKLQTTSIYPLFVWRGIAGVKSYVLTVDKTQNVLTRTVTCVVDLCSFDTFKENQVLPPGNYTWSVRVGVDGMPWSEKIAFVTSFTHVPPSPEIVQPLEQEISWIRQSAIHCLPCGRSGAVLHRDH